MYFWAICNSHWGIRLVDSRPAKFVLNGICERGQILKTSFKQISVLFYSKILSFNLSNST
jgi:hypothetical protein